MERFDGQLPSCKGLNDSHCQACAGSGHSTQARQDDYTSQ
jgi:hypothetical protein